MDKIAGMSSKDRAELFEETSNQLGLMEAAIEKDFWVCWLLKKIFSDTVLEKQLLFKGGTSLSKCFGLIERFSEDIDFILDWTLLTDEDPYAERSNTKQDKFNKSMETKARTYIEKMMLPLIRNLVHNYCTVALHAERPRSIMITYPKAFNSKYIKPEVELEFGPMSAMVPSGEFNIRPYCADVAPDLFEFPDLKVKVIEAKKTFWDKVTILHVEAHRPENKTQPLRYSRHYYDLYQMINSPTLEEAMADLPLLKEVVAFKEKFYPQGWANYRGAAKGNVKLSPDAHVKKVLADDYKNMKEIIFGDVPEFSEILNVIAKFELRLNQALTH